jgi:uncharacterized OB-fold protein
MSDINFVKGECRRCAGHLEFAAAAVGETIACPHCGQRTELIASVSPDKINGSRSKRLVIAAVVLVALSGLTAEFFLEKKTGGGAVSETQAAPAATSNASGLPVTSSVMQPKPPVEQRTNDFAIAAIKLEKTPGSALVYVTGKIRNLNSRQRFGVKIEFGLFDTNDTAVGKATDYQAMLESNGDWRFKAMVMESKAASARLNSVVEDRQ